MKRRTLLITGLGAAGALLVGVMTPRGRLGDASTTPVVDGEVGLNAWIKVAANGQVLLAMNRSEMGQGVHTGLAQLVAEELDVPLAQVRLFQAGHDTLYGNVATMMGNMPFGPRDRETGSLPLKISSWATVRIARELGINLTGGSSSIADAWEPLRLAAATARAQLLAAAAQKANAPIGELVVKDGVVEQGGRRLGHYGDFAAQAAQMRPGAVQLKDRKAWRYIGQGAARLDLPAKVNGSAQFGLDVRQPGQLFAAVRHCPMLGGGLGPANLDAVRARPGVVRVVELGSLGGSTPAYAVVARTTWHALQAARALEVQWADPPMGKVNSKAIQATLEQQARAAHAEQGGFAFASKGNVRDALAQSATRIEAVYSAPYLAHATMEPMNCTVQVKDGKVTVWAGTQAPGAAREIAARVAGVAEEAVTVHVTYLGGGFGRRLDVDFIGQATRVAMDSGGVPVQLVWSREEDMTHDFYRPAGVAVMQAGLDAQGQPTALAITNAGDAVIPRWLGRIMPKLSGLVDVLNRNGFPDGRAPAALVHPGDAPDKTAAEGLFDQPYAFAAYRMAHVATQSGVPVGSWRSVGHSHHAFFKEGFIDELAHAAKADPVAFRLKLLEGLPRHQAVLKRAAEAAGWGQALPAGRARGVALHESFGSIVAQVVEVEKVDGKPAVKRVVCAVDCGTVVNPAMVARQMESAIVFGLSAALFGRIDIVASEVQQKSFPDYPLLSLAQTPQIDTTFIDSQEPPTGVGEPGTPPVAPALANAWFALTGERKRALPLL